MFPTYAVIFWMTTTFVACSVKTTIHYVRTNGRYPEKLQSRVSSIFGPHVQQETAVAEFPYRYVFPANHPALNGPVYSQYLQQNSHQSEPLYSAEDLFTALSTTKHQQNRPQKQQHLYQQQQQQQQQQPQQYHHHPHHQPQQLGYELAGKVPYDFFGGGGSSVGGGKHHGQSQPYYNNIMTKQPKHYQNFELSPNIGNMPVNLHHQSLYPHAAMSVAQPIMLLIPSSGQPGAPYQTLVLVPSSVGPTATPTAATFPGFHQQQIQHFQTPPHFLPGLVTNPRGPPLIAGLPSGLGGGAGGSGLGKFSGTQLFHRSHEPLQQQLHHKQHKTSSSSSLLPTSYQSSGSAHVPQTTTVGMAASQQPLEDKVSHNSEASGENSNVDRVESETKLEEDKSPEFGDKTSINPLKRIVVT